ncbi:MAG: hypothetical protein ABJB02_07675 [Dokdonella sp.]
MAHREHAAISHARLILLGGGVAGGEILSLRWAYPQGEQLISDVTVLLVVLVAVLLYR